MVHKSINNKAYNYANDTNISTAEELSLKDQENLNADIETLEQWLDANKLSTNLVKTEYMIIDSSPKLKHIDFSPLIKLAGKPIKCVLKTDYLGFIIDEKLSWVDYISMLMKKISSAVVAIINLNFLLRITLITLYQSLVESRLRYCNAVCGNFDLTIKTSCNHFKTERSALLPRQNMAVLSLNNILKI